MTNALNAGGYAGQYVFQTFGTSELGGSSWPKGPTWRRIWSP